MADADRLHQLTQARLRAGAPEMAPPPVGKQPMPAVQGLAMSYRRAAARDGHYVVYLPGAFEKALQGSRPINLRKSHNKAKSYGSTADGSLEVCDGPHGLGIRWTPKCEAGQRLFEEVREGRLCGLSVGCLRRSVSNKTIAGELVVFVHEADLTEISLTEQPGMSQTAAWITNAASAPPLREAVASGNLRCRAARFHVDRSFESLSTILERAHD
ncbi:hypothetical protein DRB17_13370 [Ferruginivarius sediminum]|uniref:Prohead serine protease domain-containing protein n=2 Tax=Ferruginivarius sediminum TaxID=2661937 RepID=A0A369T801_9PROT|nr:hypothetical protein DRB17_13370 [Ferruginivarius sediminum]